MDASFGTYQLAEEHDALREAVRDIAEKEIAPYAAEVDDQERYPVEAQEALAAPVSTPCTSPRSTAVRAPTRSPPAS